METQRRELTGGVVRWRVRWRQGDRYRSQTFDRKGDAVTFAADIRRRQQLGTLAQLDLGRCRRGERLEPRRRGAGGEIKWDGEWP